MRHSFLDRYSRLSSPIHRIPAAIKLLATLVFVVVVVVVPSEYWRVFAVFGSVLLVIAGVSRIPWRFLAGRLLLLEPFALGVAVMALFQQNGADIFLGLLTKSSLCLFTMILASNTTPFSEILTVLKRVKVPSLLITILALAYRYLFVLIDEGERLQRARRSRTFESTKTKTWMSSAALIGQLFVRSTERAERIFAAMISRGWK